MKRLVIAAALLTATSPIAARERISLGGYANPSAAIAAEIAFAQLARDKGQWTAFKATATADAVMFTPQLAYVQQYLKDKPNPAAMLTWQPHQVWSSCDGSIAVTRGAWQRGDATGYFTTVWQRQNDGKYKWVMDQGDALPMPLDPPEMIVAKVADCPKGPLPRPVKRDKIKQLPPLDPAHRAGQSDDGTLTYDVTVEPDGARRFTVNLMLGGQLAPVQMVEVAAGAAQ
ncbi:MAG: hypothetical protein RLZZ427_133 [Pseudomonadota bacterium]|jgi:hypothetical protein